MRPGALLALICLALAWAAAPAVGQEDGPPTRLQVVRIWQRGELAKLADVAKSKGYLSLAQRCWYHATRLDNDDADARNRLADVRLDGDSGALAAKKRASLDKQFRQYREEASERLGDVAEQLASAGDAGGDDGEDKAPAVARDAVDLDPENAAARAILGQKRVKGWGWVSAADAARFAKGLVPLGDEWVKKSVATKRAKEWESAWIVESDHWRIRSNLPLARVFEARDLLELFVARWRADWEGFLPVREPEKKHDVLVFASESEYWAELRANDPNHTKNVPGQYSPMKRRATFYDVEVHRSESNQVSSLVELMLHECAHQLFYERLDMNRQNLEPQTAPTFWLHEGIAEYYGMHTRTKAGLAIEAKAVRAMLRTRHVKDRLDAVPVPSDLDAMQKSDYLSPDGETRLTNYATSGFLCLFLSGKSHRAGFRAVLRDAYCGENPSGLLATHLGDGGDLANLDAAFRKFLRSF